MAKNYIFLKTKFLELIWFFFLTRNLSKNSNLIAWIIFWGSRTANFSSVDHFGNDWARYNRLSTHKMQPKAHWLLYLLVLTLLRTQKKDDRNNHNNNKNAFNLKIYNNLQTNRFIKCNKEKHYKNYLSTSV